MTTTEPPVETTKALTKVDVQLMSMGAWLNKIKPQLAEALPKHVHAARVLKLALTTLRRTPALLECTRDSLLGSIVQASQLGLEFDGVLGEAYLIPRWETQKDSNGRKIGKVRVCQMLPGYKGLLKLARNTGQLSTIYAKVVHEKDEFVFEYGMREKLRHKPAMILQPGKPTYIYAFARLKDGATQFDVMSVAEVEAIRARGGNAEFSPWVTDWEAMACKTVLRKLCKMLPASVEMQRAVVLDEAIDAGIKQEFETVLTTDTGPGLTAGGDEVETQPEPEGDVAESEATTDGEAATSNVKPKPLSDLAAAAKAKREAEAAHAEEDEGDAPTAEEIEAANRKKS